MYRVEILGLRDLMGRFAAMIDGGLLAIQLEEARSLAGTIEDVYRRYAPRSRKAAGAGGGTGRHFYEGLTAEAVPTASGFSISLDTDNPELRRWLTEGTPKHLIRPRVKKALWWPQAAHPYGLVHHPGTSPNLWEAAARAEVFGLVRVAGNRIGVRVTHALGVGL